jgi:two-component system alkaline phosphatase synthesis response regulator PhoP
MRNMIKRILIVDDEPDIREVAQIGLEEIAGWEILAAGSGAEGIKRAQTVRPDAILLDVMMPDMHGAEVLAALKADPITAAIPVILLTAKVQTARQPPMGAAGVILKPFDPLSLAAQAAELLGWPAPAPGDDPAASAKLRRASQAQIDQ